jgi:molybdopterin synthase catalytic subunit
MSRVRVRIVDGPIPPEMPGSAETTSDAADEVGSRIRFEGIVRRTEAGRALAAIEYEVYEPMASRQLEAIAREESARDGVRSIEAVHSRGRVAVGEISFTCEVRSRHRAEGIAAISAFIERMKLDAAIWKNPIFADGR